MHPADSHLPLLTVQFALHLTARKLQMMVCLCVLLKCALFNQLRGVLHTEGIRKFKFGLVDKTVCLVARNRNAPLCLAQAGDVRDQLLAACGGHFALSYFNIANTSDTGISEAIIIRHANCTASSGVITQRPESISTTCVLRDITGGTSGFILAPPIPARHAARLR